MSTVDYEEDICPPVECEGCGRLARNEQYFSVMPDGEVLYWASLCVHDYEPGDEITCDCGMRCPRCQSPDELAVQREALSR
jgi:hypothetical protein